MTTHIGAKPGEIAETVLLPGDPLRAKWIAETFLDDAAQYNSVRGMSGFTGSYQGMPVSVQGSGMGMPSASIYVHELMNDFGVKTVVRVGSCGALRPEVKIRDLVLAVSASTSSSINRTVFGDMDYAATADFSMMRRLADIADEKKLSYHAGMITSEDAFYRPEDDYFEKLASHGALAVEMESAAIYRIAASFGGRAATVLTVSDHLLTGEDLPSEDRERSFSEMVELSLAAVSRSE